MTWCIMIQGLKHQLVCTQSNKSPSENLAFVLHFEELKRKEQELKVRAICTCKVYTYTLS